MIDTSLLLLLGFISILVVLSVVLLALNSTKLHNYNDVKYDLPKNIDTFSPIVYELTYVSNFNGTWSFFKDGKDIRRLVLDFKQGIITYLIIKGNLYYITKVNNNSKTTVNISLTESCNTTKSFISCGTSVNSLSTGNSTYTTLHVLAYKI